MRLGGRVIVVTGAASGIGAACVERLLAEGASVVQVDVQPCKEVPGRAIAVLGDVVGAGHLGRGRGRAVATSSARSTDSSATRASPT